MTESVLVGLYTIYRCKGGARYGFPVNYTGSDGKTRSVAGHSEFDSIHLGWSRDGFNFHRPGPFIGIASLRASLRPYSYEISAALSVEDGSDPSTVVHSVFVHKIGSSVRRAWI